MEEDENILRILEETYVAFEKKDILALRNLSNQTIHTASSHQNSINILLAVMVYSLSKILERSDYEKNPEWNKLYQSIASSIEGSVVAARAHDENKLMIYLKKFRSSVGKLSGNFKKNIEDVLRRASISKASRIYEHGISMEKTAKLLGISMYELADYSGKTGIAEMPEGKTVGVRARIKLLQSIFAGEGKIIIFDSSTLITFAMNGLLPELKKLKEIFKGKFIVPLEVKKEIIDNPLKIKRFELEALKLQELLDSKVLELPRSIGVNSVDITNGAGKILDIANALFVARKKEVHIIDLGEAACLALSQILDKQGIEYVTAIDERTTRLLCEKPENLRSLLEKKLHTKVSMSKGKNFSLNVCKIVRSAELIYFAYKKGLVRFKGNKVLEALLYAVQFKGCSISHEEIDEMKKLK